MRWPGFRAAQKLLGTEPQPLSFERGNFRPIPMYNGKPWFVPLVSGWYRLQDKVDKLRD